ncbi:MAG TPA: hypothetical protein VFE05_23780 [Longimicrobiaceae bacterium]|jgi:hypothetical protein|nr:hypothetical protein [Longimicrobiaceae bacterium]
MSDAARQAADDRNGGASGDADTPGADRAFAAVGAVALLLALYFIYAYLTGAPADTGAAVSGPPAPQLVIESPQDGEIVDQPASVVFRTTAKLEAGPMGWSAGGRHLHLRAGSTELMAGVPDIQPAGPGRWRWTLPRLPQGEYPVRLMWSGADHVPIVQGASDLVDVRLR